MTHDKVYSERWRFQGTWNGSEMDWLAFRFRALSPPLKYNRIDSEMCGYGVCSERHETTSLYKFDTGTRAWKCDDNEQGSHLTHAHELNNEDSWENALQMLVIYDETLRKRRRVNDKDMSLLEECSPEIKNKPVA